MCQSSKTESRIRQFLIYMKKRNNLFYFTCILSDVLLLLGDIYFMGFNGIAYVSVPQLLFCCVEGADNRIHGAVQFDLQQQTTLNSTQALPQQGAIPNQISP